MANKEYCHWVSHLICFLGAIRKQLAAFLEGFYEIIPKRLISIFTEQELELLISGLPTIDIDDLKANTEYHKYQSSSIQVWMTKLISAHLHMWDRTDIEMFRDITCRCVSVILTLENIYNASAFVIGILFTLDPVVLEGLAVLWPGRPSQVPTVCHWHIQSSPPGFCCFGGHEWHPEVSDPPWWSLHWPPTIRSYLVKT